MHLHVRHLCQDSTFDLFSFFQFFFPKFELLNSGCGLSASAAYTPVFTVTNISKIRSYLDRESTEAIIHAFVTTNLDYCNAILYGLPKVLLNRLQLVQNRAARIVTFTKKYEHITPSLIDLHWLPVDYRITYKILLLVYKAINGFSPSYISNLLSFCSSSYSLRSCSNKLLQVPRSKLKSYGDRRFSIAGPKLWNSIPASLRNADSLNSFKKHLKTYLFHQAFS